MSRYSQEEAKKEWVAIPRKLAAGLRGWASRDFCALECLANDRLYAKPDSQKIFLLWEAKLQEGIEIEVIPGIVVKHSWALDLFIDLEKRIVRFPFNTWDSEPAESLSWDTINASLRVDGFHQRLLQLPRWSTASRSCLALIPENVSSLPGIAADGWDTRERFQLRQDADKPWVNVPEWKTYNVNRFTPVVGDPGRAASSAGTVLLGQPRTSRYRLYSVKTGVRYVGSKDESGAGKNRLEANSSLAMLRSEVIESMPNNDVTFGVQTEVLTITAPMVRYNEGDANPIADGRDGFQVRDLSCMWPGLDYIPGQAIPYARAAFEGRRLNAEQQCAFWRRNFAVPLGRAKARLFLNYGLVHTSANAQNFLLGFSDDVLKQFVARDIGDTSWHDDYLGRYAMRTPPHRAFTKEKASDIRHLLHETSSGAYPPPHIVRLAAYSVLTHGFAKVLEENNDWSKALLYKFATGILDGFRDYMMEALLLPKLPDPVDQDLPNDENIKDYGVSGKYPTDQPKLKEYQKLVNRLLKMDSNLLFSLADFVRKRGEDAANADQLEAFGVGAADGINILINAEEILLCAGIEIRLGMAPGKDPPKDISDQLKFCLTGHWPAIVTR